MDDNCKEIFLKELCSKRNIAIAISEMAREENLSDKEYLELHEDSLKVVLILPYGKESFDSKGMFTIEEILNSEF